MSELPPECDFCGQWLDEDEELHPIFVGEPPEPKAVTARATAEADQRVMGRQVDNSGLPRDDIQVLGRPMGQVKALMEALETHSNIEVAYQEAVQEVHSVGLSEQPEAIVADYDSDRVGVHVHVEPRSHNPEPDMMVCDFCKDEFQS